MDKKKLYLLGIGALIVVLVALGISYAYWMLTLIQPDKNVVTTDCFKIEFTGENDINLASAYPMGETELENFYNTATPYHFTIANVCSSKARVLVNLETLDGAEKRLNDEYIDVLLYDGTKSYGEITSPYIRSKLTDVPLNTNKVIPESLNAYKLYEFTLDGNTNKEFNLLLNMDPDTPGIDAVMNAVFKSKVTMYASYIETESTP